MKLTEKRVRDAKSIGTTRIIWDDELKGLGLRITAAGFKAYVLDYRIAGDRSRITLGSTAELSLAAARDNAAAMKLRAKSGHNPLAEKRALEALPRVSDALTRFVDEFLPEKERQGEIRESTAKEYRRQIEKHMRPDLGRLRVRDVTAAHVEQMLRRIKGPVSRNRVLSLASRLFSQFEKWSLIEPNANPASSIDKFSEEERDRTLSADELASLGRALSESSANEWGILAIRIAALTGLRIGEVRNMRWEDIDLATGRVVLPRTKTGRRVHSLPSAALALLADAKRVGPYVVAGRSADAPLHDRQVRKIFDAAAKSAGLCDVRLHDLRRTVATRAAASGASAHLIRDLLGHKTMAMASRYVKMVEDDVVDLRERAGAEMAASMEGKTGDVVSLKRRQG